MGSSSKKKDKESRKRKHRDAYGDEYHEPPREKRHKHKHKHHKEKKRSKHAKQGYRSEDSDVVEIIDSPPPPPSKPIISHQRTPSPKAPKPPKVLTPSPPRVERYIAPPEPTRQHTESLSIDEANRLRAKLGLKPLDVGSSSAPSSSSSSKRKEDSGNSREERKIKDDLGEFYHKPAENWKTKAEQEKLREKIQQQKDKRHLQSKLTKVKLLADSDDDVDAAQSWVEKSRKLEQQKKEAEKRAKMLEELDEQFGISEVIESEERNKRNDQYTHRHLKGLRVEHDVTSFKDERTTILTLKDQDVLGDTDDVLINVNMIDEERYKKNVENKKKKQPYNLYEEEFDEFGNLVEKSLLSKYDEEIDGARSDSFIIGQEQLAERRQAAAQSVKEKLAKKRIESIIPTDLRVASDYYNEDEMAKFKKPKKKIRKIRAKGKLTLEGVEEVNNKGIEDIGSRRPKFKNDPDVFNIDDVPFIEMPTNLKLEDDKDDILEKALHKARTMKQKENVIAELISNTIVKPELVEEENMDTGSSIVLNATAEFCRTLGDIPTYGKAGNREEVENELVDFDKEALREEILDDEITEEPEISGWNSVDPNEARESSHIVPQEIQILDEEPDVSAGVSAALKLATSKGYLDKEQKNRPSNTRLAHLQAKHYSIEDKVYGDDGDRAGRRERYCGPITEFRERECFKPNVKLEYIDDDGHILNSKEAFRYLSHKFHGKGPGKNKIEKRIKKNVQEQLMKKMSSTDTPLGTLNMLQAKQKETQSPFIVLSGSKQTQSTVISKTNRR